MVAQILNREASQSMKGFAIPLLSAIFFLTACSSTNSKLYSSTAKQNFTIKTNINNGDSSESIEAVLGVNDVDKNCESQFQGSVSLKSGINRIGLKPEELTYVIVVINSSSFRGNRSFQRGSLIKPKSNVQYEILVNYVDSMYDLQFFQETKRGKKKLDLIPFSACRKS